MQQGFRVTPVHSRAKDAFLDDWANHPLTEADLDKYFANGPMNIGLILGEPGGLTDVDADSIEALYAWPEFAIETGMIWGRRSMPASHNCYYSDPPLRSIKLLDPTDGDELTRTGRKASLIEIRCLTKDGKVGLQTVVPPSVHPSGETVEFARSGFPANVEGPQLVTAVRRTAASALLGRYAPGEGARHQFFLDVAGMLAHAKWALEDACRVLRAIYRIIWRHKADLAAANKEVESTYQRYDDGGEVTGIPHLEHHLSKKVLKAVLTWLEIVSKQQKKERPLPTIVPCSFDVLSTRDIKMPEQLIQDILVRPGVTLMVGAPKAGKTILAVDMLLSLAAGVSLFEWYQVRGEGCPSLIVEQDDSNGEASLKNLRMKSRRFRNGAPHYFVTGTRFTIGDGDLDRWLLDQIQKLHIGLVVLDAYTSLRSIRPHGVDIVKAEESDMRFLTQIAPKTNCAILLLHHDSKSSSTLEWASRAAGTYALGANTDAHIFVSRFPEFSEGEPERLLRVRSRHMAGKELVVRFCENTMDYDLVLEGDAACLYPEIKQLRHHFPGSGPQDVFTAKQVREETGWSQPNIYRILNRLTRSGVLRKTGNTWSWT
jgi:hypothetical protein